MFYDSHSHSSDMVGLSCGNRLDGLSFSVDLCSVPQGRVAPEVLDD